MSYDGELTSNILLDDNDDGTFVPPANTSGSRAPFDSNALLGPSSPCGASSPWDRGDSPSFGPVGSRPTSDADRRARLGGESVRQSTRGLAPHTRADGEGPNRTPTRTPSPVYQVFDWGDKGGFGDDGPMLPPQRGLPSVAAPGADRPPPNPIGAFPAAPGAGITKSCSSTTPGEAPNPQPAPQQLFQQQMPWTPLFYPSLGPGPGTGFNPGAYCGGMVLNPMIGQMQAPGDVKGAPFDPNLLQMMMAMQAGGAAAGMPVQNSGAAASSTTNDAPPETPKRSDEKRPQQQQQQQQQSSGSLAGLAVGQPVSKAGTQPAGGAAADPDPSKSRVGKSKNNKVSRPEIALPVSQSGPPVIRVDDARPVSPPPQPRNRGANQGSTIGVIGGGKGERRRRGGGSENEGGRAQQATPLPPGPTSGAFASSSQNSNGGERGRSAKASGNQPPPPTSADRVGGHSSTGSAAANSANAGARGSKSRPENRPGTTHPLIEALKHRDKNVDLVELAPHIAEIAQDQYGSRLIQQKLEDASDEEKALAFKSVLQRMNPLTMDVFGNYVIQKFFEFGSNEQRRILAEQLVGQVLKLSLHMYGCRVVQKAFDSVPIDQQVLLIGELKGHVLECIEDQHGNHVIQKCIERLPTDRIGFIVDSFKGSVGGATNMSRMAKHCYGCRVIQRLIEYCSAAQIADLLDETLACCMELATDQYGNYVVQHVMEHSSRPGDRQTLMAIVRNHILALSCHKYASNVIEKALSCGTSEERALLIQALVGDPGAGEAQPPLLTMMRDRFGNYIVQKSIGLAQGPQRDALMWKLQEHMPSLKKSNTYGKHIIAAMEKSQSARGPLPFRPQ